MDRNPTINNIWNSFDSGSSLIKGHMEKANSRKRKLEVETGRKSPISQVSPHSSKLRLYLDNDETLVSVKTEGEIPSVVRKMHWETHIIQYRPSTSNTKRPSLKLFVKVRQGVVQGLRRLAKMFDLVICSTGETSYIREMLTILDPQQ